MQTIAVISRKGGVGKTTLSVNLASAAHAAGLKVVLADLDSQRSATAWGRLRGERPGPAVLETTSGKLFPLWSAAANARVDVMVIDTPAAPEDDALQALRLADLALLISRPNYFDISALARSIELVRRMEKRGLIVLNQAPSRRMGLEPPQVLSAARSLRLTGLPLASIGLRSRAAFPTAAAQGLSAAELDPEGPAAREVAGVWAEARAILDDDKAPAQPGVLPAMHAIQTGLGLPA